MTVLRRLLLTAIALAAMLAIVPIASAATCAQDVIDDWWDNGKVDETYPVRCYRQAIDALPEDLTGYSSAADDINRALQERLRDQQSPDSGDSEGTGENGSSGSDTGSGTETDAGAGSDQQEEEPGTETRGTQSGGTDTEEGSTTEESSGGVSGSGGSDAGSGGTGGASGQNGEDGSVADAPVAAPPENLFGEDLDDGAGGPLPVPLIIVLAALGLAALAVAVKLVLARRGGHGGGAPGSSGAEPGA